MLQNLDIHFVISITYTELHDKLGMTGLTAPLNLPPSLPLYGTGMFQQNDRQHVC